MTRKALGRGLGALLSVDRSTTLDDEPFEVAIDLINPSPFQPRNTFDATSLQKLSESIITHGVVQPVVLRRQGERFELVAGERRWRAAKIAGLTRIPAVVREIKDENLLEIALIENIQREDLNPIEEASAYKNLIEAVGLTQETLAARIGRDRSYITNYLRLLRLPEDLQRLVSEGKLTAGHARTILGLEQPDQQRRVARRIIEGGLSVRDTERLVRKLAQERPQRPDPRANDANVRAAETKLRRRYGTQIRIRQQISGAGTVEIAFYNNSDLERLFDLLLCKSTVGVV